jgi:hypothetical protein
MLRVDDGGELEMKGWHDEPFGSGVPIHAKLCDGSVRLLLNLPIEEFRKSAGSGRNRSGGSGRRPCTGRDGGRGWHGCENDRGKAEGPQRKHGYVSEEVHALNFGGRHLSAGLRMKADFLVVNPRSTR